jgi:uncharacterized protein YfaT (DUF1175 family)
MRRTGKGWLWSIGVCLLAVASLFFLLRHRHHSSLVVTPLAASFPADGREHAVMLLKRQDRRSLSSDEVTVRAMDDGSLRAIPVAGAIQVLMQAPVKAVDRNVRIMQAGRAGLRKVHFATDDSDSYGDGTPDALRLHLAEDRAAFRRWFWSLAELQAELPDAQKAAEITDCSALLRYAYREALRRHDAAWASEQHVGDITFPSVLQWRYPETILGTGLFRVRPGRFASGDESNGAFTQFADAHALMAWNTHLVGRSLRAAKPGDLIFYRQLEQNSPYHSMVVTGNDAAWVVYHTGPIGKNKGEIRRMALTDLLRHPDARWRPLAENSNFLGVFRWNVLREGE